MTALSAAFGSTPRRSPTARATVRRPVRLIKGCSSVCCFSISPASARCSLSPSFPHPPARRGVVRSERRRPKVNPPPLDWQHPPGAPPSSLARSDAGCSRSYAMLSLCCSSLSRSRGGRRVLAPSDYRLVLFSDFSLQRQCNSNLRRVVTPSGWVLKNYFHQTEVH
ncbi:hypothetical protein CDAR_371611 [Caerostris darwini]|uniref:Uncharacterized protein n=1 Tax=Caerostris darwini TaxID=1538125 RepID=A0AAV4XBI5_9ARAC|nr:hypothetical protein CDAR_371611 [Caerostris darwini]